MTYQLHTCCAHSSRTFDKKSLFRTMRAPLHIAYQMVVIMALGGMAGIYCKNTFPTYGLWYMMGILLFALVAAVYLAIKDFL